jgi:hypothetical protein
MQQPSVLVGKSSVKRNSCCCHGRIWSVFDKRIGTSSQSSKKDGRRRSNTFIKDRPNSSMAAAGITFHRGFSHEDTWLLHQILIILMAQYSLH